MFKNTSSRRSFLKATLAGALFLAGALDCRPAQASATPELPEGLLSLFNTHTGERLSIAYRRPDGSYDPAALESLDWILRCHYTNEPTAMDLRTIEYLNLLDKQLGGGNEIHIISGYRSPKYNDLLLREGHHVARHSLHLSGQAIDIAIPRVELSEVRRTALDLRRGGVGFYPGDGFVHIDSGSFRTW